jgi:hypothetical protein
VSNLRCVVYQCLVFAVLGLFRWERSPRRFCYPCYRTVAEPQAQANYVAGSALPPREAEAEASYVAGFPVPLPLPPGPPVRLDPFTSVLRAASCVYNSA